MTEKGHGSMVVNKRGTSLEEGGLAG